MLHHLESPLARLATHDPDHRRAVVLLGPVAPPLVGSPPGRIIRVGMQDALFSGILIHLIRFHFRVVQGPPIQAGLGSGLIFMSQLEQISPAATQLPSELGSGHPLGETPDDEDQHRGTIMGPLEHGPGPSVEDTSTRRATIVEDGFTIVAVDEELMPNSAAGTVQSLGMEQVEEELVASVLIQKRLDRKVHGWGSPGTERHSLRKKSRQPHRMSRVGQYHFEPMSRGFIVRVVLSIVRKESLPQNGITRKTSRPSCVFLPLSRTNWRALGNFFLGGCPRIN